jgi:hypothetical protein
MMFCDARKGQLEWRKTTGPLRGPWAAIPPRKCGHAPLPASPARNLLADLRVRTAAARTRVRDTVETERWKPMTFPHLEDRHKCQ